MCLRNLQKFGAWALIEAEILTSPHPMYLLNLAQFWVPVLCQWVHHHLPCSLKMFLCVSGTSKRNLVCGTIIEAEILTSPLPYVFAQFSQVLGAGTHGCVNTSQVVKKCFYVSQEPPKNGALIEAEILTSPLPHVFVQLTQVLGACTLPTGVSTPPKGSSSVSMCLRNLQKCGACKHSEK